MMEYLLLGSIPVLTTIATIAIALLFRGNQPNAWLRFCCGWQIDIRVPASKSVDKFGAIMIEKGVDEKELCEADTEELKFLKQLYYQLHSLEKYPETLLPAKRLLLSLLKETSLAASVLPESESILSVKLFSRERLKIFLHKRNNDVGKQWEKYNLRRRNRGQRELFEDRDEAAWWLKQIAPIKLVDGAWLGYISRVTAPFALRKALKGAWQILSEELGDGDLGKNHVHVYRNLLESVAPGLPTPEMVDFGHPRHRLDDLSVWKAAIVQLLISLFPQEFLPEILGYNLHFEAISMETLKAVKELKEVGIDPYYFILHISIDNAHSGHSVIAIEVVCEYMDYVLRCEGEEAAHQAWMKIQAGYNLSAGLPGTVVCASRRRPVDVSSVVLSPIEQGVMKIFRQKHKSHLESTVVADYGSENGE